MSNHDTRRHWTRFNFKQHTLLQRNLRPCLCQCGLQLLGILLAHVLLDNLWELFDELLGLTVSAVKTCAYLNEVQVRHQVLNRLNGLDLCFRVHLHKLHGKCRLHWCRSCCCRLKN